MLISSPGLLGSGGRDSNHHLDYIRAEPARGLDCETRNLNAELMNAFFVEIVNPANLLATVLLGGVLLYWLLVIFGAVGMDALEIDLDLDADGDFGLEFADGIVRHDVDVFPRWQSARDDHHFRVCVYVLVGHDFHQPLPESRIQSVDDSNVDLALWFGQFGGYQISGNATSQRIQPSSAGPGSH